MNNNKGQDEPKAKFVHLRDSNNNLYATICTITDDVRKAVGVSILGDHDVFNRKLGRRISLGRARRAYYTGRKSFPVNNTHRKNVETYILQNMLTIDIKNTYKSFSFLL